MRQTGWVLAFLLVIGLAALAPATQAGRAAAASAPLDSAVRTFGALSAAHSWVMSDADLLFTEDGGASWRRATPPGMALGNPAAVAFLTPDVGWLATLAPSGVLSLAGTADGAHTWQQQDHVLFAPGDPAGNAAGLALYWLDGATGWLVVRQATSSNFNRGVLFGTQDGGASWQRLALPGGEPVVFATTTTGWTAGGPHGDTWFRTQDGGHTWTVAALPYVVEAGRGQRRHYPPFFAAGGRQGVIVVTTTTASGQRVDWYVTDDGGDRWTAVANSPANAATSSSLAEVDAAAWLMVRSGQPLLAPAVAAPFFANPRLDWPEIALALVAPASPETGWAADARGGRLLRTEDGGQSWQVQIYAGDEATAPAVLTRPGRVNAAGAVLEDRTARLAGAGFDMCELASEEELRRWIEEGPYRAVNLYIGGEMRACDNAALGAPKLATLAAQGWTFIPTWVGPQAPCTEYRQRFDLDPTTAFGQGRAEAKKALQVAAALELADAGGSGTVIYYDLEAYDGEDTACVAAARAFVAGWSQRLQEGGSYAGLYGLACNPPIGDYASLTPAPDAVWFAAWNRDQFDPMMSVMTGIPAWCLAPAVWDQQQRIRQYTTSHDETWGGVTLEIDSNVLDGIVADLAGVTPPPVTVIVETPDVTPVFDAATACADGWHRFTNGRGEAAYLAYGQPLGATIPPLNYGVWRPTLPITGTYRVEALIASHGEIAWPCRELTLGPDTRQARYTIHHRDGVATTEQDQLPLNDEWLGLGSYPFAAGGAGFVYLDAAVADAPRHVGFSAVRFVLEFAGDLTERVYLPAVSR
jgi:photosystem II stability/assembly factor-like uncharacterized protein